MKLLNTKLDNIFKNKKAVKLISGIENLNVNEILKYIQVCKISQATYIDVVANPKIVSFIKSMTDLPICVSSIDVKSLYYSVIAGADVIEIGNFDIFYNKGIVLSSQQILTIAKQIRNLLPFIDICVTIPYTLTLNEQLNLALRLEDIGINIVQTEGSISKVTYSDLLKKNISKDYLFDSILKASSTLSSVYLLSNKLHIPIVASSGINSLTGPLAFAYGASCIGIKSGISTLSNINEMSLFIHEIRSSLYINSLHKKRDLRLNSSSSCITKTLFYGI